MTSCDNCGSECQSTSPLTIFTVREVDRTTRYNGPDKIHSTIYGEALAHQFQVCPRCHKRHSETNAIIRWGGIFFLALTIILAGSLHLQGVVLYLLLGLGVGVVLVTSVYTGRFWKLNRRALQERNKLQPHALYKALSAEQMADLGRGMGV